MNEVILHGGDIHGHDKITAMQRLKFWKADQWKEETGRALIQKVSAPHLLIVRQDNELPVR